MDAELYRALLDRLSVYIDNIQPVDTASDEVIDQFQLYLSEKFNDTYNDLYVDPEHESPRDLETSPEKYSLRKFNGNIEVPEIDTSHEVVWPQQTKDDFQIPLKALIFPLIVFSLPKFPIPWMSLSPNLFTRKRFQPRRRQRRKGRRLRLLAKRAFILSFFMGKGTGGLGGSVERTAPGNWNRETLKAATRMKLFGSPEYSEPVPERLGAGVIPQADFKEGSSGEPIDIVIPDMSKAATAASDIQLPDEKQFYDDIDWYSDFNEPWPLLQSKLFVLRDGENGRYVELTPATRKLIAYAVKGQLQAHRQLQKIESALEEYGFVSSKSGEVNHDYDREIVMNIITIGHPEAASKYNEQEVVSLLTTRIGDPGGIFLASAADPEIITRLDINKAGLKTPVHYGENHLLPGEIQVQASWDPVGLRSHANVEKAVDKITEQLSRQTSVIDVDRLTQNDISYLHTIIKNLPDDDPRKNDYINMYNHVLKNPDAVQSLRESSSSPDSRYFGPSPGLVETVYPVFEDSVSVNDINTIREAVEDYITYVLDRSKTRQEITKEIQEITSHSGVKIQVQ